jgi:hypothetical protein
MGTRMWLIVIYVSLQNHSIGIVLQLDGHYGAITLPLIKYYQFIIHIKCKLVDLKLDPNVALKIF